MSRYKCFILLAVLVGIADQVIKYLMMDMLAPGQNREVINGLLALVMWYNPGAAFGGLSEWEYSRWFLTFVAFVAIGAAFFLLRGQAGNHRRVVICLGLVAGGALGNLVDRIRFGWVIDYILVYYKEWYWPAFNLADMAITMGGIMLIIFLWRLTPSK